jgi:ribosomal protein S18 acetylase RimI-like enzyme
LLSRELESLPAPFSLWHPRLRAKDIKEAALKVAGGQALAIWVDESHPAMGLALYQPQLLESQLLGYGAGRLFGPYLVDPVDAQRQERGRILAHKAMEKARGFGTRFLSIKTGQDPAVIRGLCAAGFQVAEIITRLCGSLGVLLAGSEDSPRLDTGRGGLSGLSLLEPGDPKEAVSWLEMLGDLFYDGHHRHSPFLPPDLSGSLWRAVASRLLEEKSPSLFLWDGRQKAPVAMALAQLDGDEAFLAVMHVAEECRNQGLGAYLLRQLSKNLRQAGAQNLWAETASWNLPALALYQSLGLKPQAPTLALHAELGAPDKRLAMGISG